MKKKLFAVLLSIALIVTLAPTAFASDDTTPPVIDSVSINNTEFNVGDTITVTVMGHDTESGLDTCQIRIEPNGSFYNTICLENGNVKAIDGGLQGSFTIGNEFIGGSYKVDSVTLFDQRGNHTSQTYDPSLYPALSFTVHSSYVPSKGPDLSGLSANKTKARVGETVTYRLTATHPTGVAAASMKLCNQDAPWFTWRTYDVPLTSVSGQPGVFTGNFTITADIQNTTLYPCDIVLTPVTGIKSYIYFPGLPESTNKNKVSVINPAVPLPTQGQYPVIKSCTVSATQMLPGQTLTVNADVDQKTAKVDHLEMYIEAVKSAYDMTYSYFKRLTLTSQGNGIYSASMTLPMDFEPGEYVLRAACEGYLANGNSGEVITPPALEETLRPGYYYIKGAYIKVSPVLSVSGTANVSIPAGTAFDAMQGVSASNAYTGDVTSKITVVGGNIDTSVPGIYLVKYKVSDTFTAEGRTMSSHYTDYRWVGVTEIIPGDNQGELVVSTDSININAASSEVNLTLNGSAIPFQSTVTAGGTYTVAVKSSLGEGKYGAAARNMAGAAKMVIDKASPTINPTWKRIDARTVCVNPGISDPSGIAEMKYLPGKKTMDAVKNTGILFNGTFNISKFGYYTVYGIDKQGAESYRVINIKNIPLKRISFSFILSSAYAGDMYQLSAILNPTNATDQRITWTSSNTKAVVVDQNGKMTMVGAVKATITVKCAGKKATFKITVKVRI